MSNTWQDPEMADRFTRMRNYFPKDCSYDIVLRLLDDIGRPPRLIVDLGCGTGAFSAPMLDRYPNAQLVMVDYSARMLDQVRDNHGNHTRVSIIEADLSLANMQDIVGNAQPDAVVSGFAIHHLTRDRQRALYASIYDVLAPGGVFINAEHTASNSPRHERMFYEHMADGTFANAQAAGDDLSHTEIMQMMDDGKDVNILTHVFTQCDWLREIGYRDVDCAHKVFEKAVLCGYKAS